VNQINFTSQKRCPVCNKPVHRPEMPFCSGRCYQRDKKSAPSASNMKEVEALLRQYRQSEWGPVDCNEQEKYEGKTEWDIPAKKGKNRNE